MADDVIQSEESCRKCLGRAGKQWSSKHGSDLGEGLCPKESGEVYVCRETGKGIIPTGRVKIIGCR